MVTIYSAEYLLPVLLDDTKLQGVPQTQGYLVNKSPYEVATLFAKKVDKNIDVKLMRRQLEDELPGYIITIGGDKVHFICEEESFESEYPLSFLMELYKLNLLFELFVAPAIVPNKKGEFVMLCKYCGKPLNESQYSRDEKYKSCPRCSTLNGKEHVYFPYPSEFGTTAKRESTNHPDGPQSYCTNHRSNPSNPIQAGGIVCSEF